MNFNLTEEQKILRDSCARFMRERYRWEERAVALDTPRGYNPDVWKSLADMGWLALSVPEADGGLGDGFVETAIVMEQCGRALLLEPFLTGGVLCGAIVSRSPAGELRTALLEALMAGEARMALAHGEDGSGDMADAPIKTIARNDGDTWLLDGEKLAVLAAPSASVFIVSARLAGVPDAVGLFAVDANAPGIHADFYELIDRTRAADLALRNCRVPTSSLLCGPEAAIDLLDLAIDRAGLAAVAESLGCMEAVVEITAEHIKTRVQFGQAIGRFQALQHRMAEMFIELRETRSILYQGMAHIDGTATERREAVSAARVYAANAGRFVGGQGIQLHGGVGVTEEYRVGQYYKKLLLLEKLFGDSNWHRRRFAAARSKESA
jgi:alkylation response protein AidB-like acyl-CoA dehydrogenase